MRRLFAVLIGLALSSSAWATADNVQIPPAVKQQVSEIQDHFTAVLDEECPAGTCYSVGCKASRFDTLDQTQDASLPGLETDAVSTKPQYRLASVLCELAYEPTLSAEDLSNIRQRIRQKVTTVGIDVQLSTRPLQPKPAEAPARGAGLTPPVATELTWQAALWQKVLPFLPWFLGTTLLTLMILALIWGVRRLGRQERRGSGVRTRASDLLGGPSAAGSEAALIADPTPRMLLTRVELVRDEMKGDKRLTELALKKHFDEENYAELCAFLKYFGPELLTVFKEKAEYRAGLGVLSEKYAANTLDDDPGAMWRYLDRLERDLTAAKVRIDAEPLAEDFAFLSTLEVEEFVGILRELTEEEAIAAVSYAPRILRERFFGHANPSFTAKFVEHLTSVDKMPDSFVRAVAHKLRRIYSEKGNSLRQIRVDRIPLLEEALNALEPGKRRALIASLGKDHPDFVHSVAPAVFLDDALPMLPPEILTEALLTLAPEEAGHYLALFPWAPEVLSKINPRLSEGIRKHFPVPPIEGSKLARTAHTKLATYIKNLHAQGTLDLRQINSKLVGDEA